MGPEAAPLEKGFGIGGGASSGGGGVLWTEQEKGRRVLEPEFEQGGAGSFLGDEQGKDLCAQGMQESQFTLFFPRTGCERLSQGQGVTGEGVPYIGDVHG